MIIILLMTVVLSIWSVKRFKEMRTFGDFSHRKVKKIKQLISTGVNWEIVEKFLEVNYPISLHSLATKTRTFARIRHYYEKEVGKK